MEDGKKYADESIISISAVVLSDIAAHQGDAVAALKWGELALAHIPTPFDHACATLQYGVAKCLAGDRAQGIAMLEAVAPAMRASGFYPGEYWNLHLGNCYLWDGRYEDARQLGETFLTDFAHDPDHYYLMLVNALLGDAYLGLGDADSLTRAEAHYTRALRKAEHGGAQKEWAPCEFGLGRLRARQGQRLQANELLQRALRRFEAHGFLLAPAQVRAELARI